MRVPELIAATVSGLASQFQDSAHRAARPGDRWSSAAHRFLPGDAVVRAETDFHRELHPGDVMSLESTARSPRRFIIG
jgi:hypothetical protein